MRPELVRGRPSRIYLAGPDVFAPDARARGQRLKALCRALGAEGLFPLDNEASGRADLARFIREANMAMIRACDAVVANMAPFRGPGMDGGTAYEMGVAAALGKLVVGYTPEPNSYVERVRRLHSCREHPDGLRDADGYLVEDFGVWAADNLMMAWGVDALFSDPAAAIRHAVDRLRGHQVANDKATAESCGVHAAVEERRGPSDVQAPPDRHADRSP